MPEAAGLPRIVTGDPGDPDTWNEIHPGDARASGVLILPAALLPGHSWPEARQILADRILAALDIHPDAPDPGGVPWPDKAFDPPEGRFHLIDSGPIDIGTHPPRLDDLVADLYPLLIHDPQGEPVTDLACLNLSPHEAHDWWRKFPNGADRQFHCPGVEDPADEDAETDDTAFVNLEQLVAHVAKLRDERRLDRDRHTRQMTELGQQLVAVHERIDKTQAELSALTRRVTELEDDAPEDDLEGFTGDDPLASTGVAMLEAYRQGQRDAYAHCNALVRNADSSTAILATLRDLAGEPS